MHRFYTPELTEGTTLFTLSEAESKHGIQVMRLKENDSIELFNGKGISALTTIIEAHPKRCSVKIEKITKHSTENPVHIAIAPTKNMDRMEWFIEKACEIGLTKLSLILCQNSERREIKLDRLEKTAVAAIKQSGRYFVPEIVGLTKWKDFLNQHPNGLIAHCRDGEKKQVHDFTTNYPILIGPEGDFTKEEIELALLSGYSAITLGDNRLRTETAALVACMQVKFGR
jgi:16S rRNA (uracil1498-N3)-methyltransferase